MRLKDVLESDRLSYSRKIQSKSDNPYKIYKNMGIYLGYELDSNTVNSVINFCTDFNIPNCVEDELQIPLLVSKKYSEEIKYDESILKEDIYIDHFDLKTEKLQSGMTSLVAYFESDDLQQIRSKFAEYYNIKLNKTSKYRPYFVVSKNVENREMDLENLTVRFNEYVPYSVATQAFLSAFDNRDKNYNLIEHASGCLQHKEIVNFNYLDERRLFGDD